MFKKLIPIAFTFCLLSTTIPLHSLAAEPETSSTNQSETIQAKPPQWSELCPGIYCASSTIEIPEAKPHVGVGFAVLAGFVPILIPFEIIKERQANKSDWAVRRALSQNYWVQRRGDFEREISQCQQMKDNDKLVDCYMQVRQNETNKNQARRQEMLMIDQVNALHSLQFRPYGR
jgi:hypothetical protein